MGGAAGSLQKAILFPTGCVCFEQEKRGPVYPHLVQLSLESFSAPLYNILVIRNKGVPDESSPTHLGRLFFYRHSEDAAECAAEVDRYLMGYTNL